MLRARRTEGTPSPLRTITHPGGSGLYGLGLSIPGQMARPARIDQGPPMIVLLTPSAP